MATSGQDRFLTDFTRLMEQEDADAVTQFFEDDQKRSQLADRAWDVLGMLSAHASDSPASSVDPAFHRICDYLIRFLASTVKPKEFLVMALEQIEQFKEDAKFRLFLDPLRTCLTRLGIDKFHSVDFVIGALYAHVRSLRPLPAAAQQAWNTEKELNSLHGEPHVKRLLGLTGDLVSFVGDLVVLSRESPATVPTPGGYRRFIMRHLVTLLDWPLTYIDLVTRAEEREEGETPTDAFQLLVRAFKLVSELARHDVHLFVQHALRNREVSGLEAPEDEGEEEEEQLGEDTRYPAKGLLVVLYCAYFPHPMGGDTPALPQIRAPLHCLHAALPLILGAMGSQEAMQVSETLATRTALSLLRQLLARIPDSSLAPDSLQQDGTGRVLERLTALVGYHESRLVRHLALRCLTRWFWAMRGREAKWRLFLHVWRRSEHAGLRGHFVTLVKNQLHLALRGMGEPDFCQASGSAEILKTIARGSLPHGATTDLLEQQDLLLPTLNLFIYLALSDSGDRSGVWRIADWLEEEVLTALRTALNMSRAHYRHRAEVEEDDEGGAEVSVGGVALPHMTREEKQEVFQSALVRFDLMESVLGQLTSVMTSRRPPCILENKTASVQAIA